MLVLDIWLPPFGRHLITNLNSASEAGSRKNHSFTEVEAGFIHTNDASLTEIEAGFMHTNDASLSEIEVGFMHTNDASLSASRSWIHTKNFCII